MKRVGNGWVIGNDVIITINFFFFFWINVVARAGLESVSSHQR